jgi:hypothetical protein
MRRSKTYVANAAEEEHPDVEQLGAGSRAEGVEAFP